MNTRSAPYMALVHSLADQDSRAGWRSALELPHLSAEDADLVAEEYPEEVQEGLHEAMLLTPLRPYLREGDFMLVGIKYATAMRESARHVIWPDVQEECEKRREDEADAYAEAHPESAESRHGVAGLFRG